MSSIADYLSFFYSVILKIMYIQGETTMLRFGELIGARLTGGEVFELIGDVGAGKTTFTRGLAKGLDVTEPIQSPTFTINREYQGRDDLRLMHYDFYRLTEAGIMEAELAEALADSHTVTVVEWSDVVSNVLPKDHVSITILPTRDNEERRELQYCATGHLQNIIQEALECIS